MLASCIMPTRERRRFVPFALAYFLRQDYERCELIVVDDGDDPVGDLIPDDPRVRYVRLPRAASVGAKRNLACEAARGEVILHWDDDDWYAPDRVSRQVRALAESGRDVCGTSEVRYYDPAARHAWEYRYPAELRRWVAGGTLAYRRAFWAEHRFADVDVGEDAQFVWSTTPDRIAVIDDPSFYLGTIHASNVSPKHTGTAYWRPCPVELVERQLGADFASFEVIAGRAQARPLRAPPALRNVYACLVHESRPCIADLVRNLHHTDPDSTVLLYNGSADRDLLRFAYPFASYNAVVHPAPRPMRWGWLHGFAIDAMRFALDELGANALTIVDSDQLAVRAGYARRLASFVEAHPDVGLIGSSARVEHRGTTIAPAATAWKEHGRWLPLLRRFPNGEAQFVRWTFWPSTVFTERAMRDLVTMFERDRDLAALLESTSMWATEEILFPTLTALLGHGVAENPCANDYVRYKVPCAGAELERALNDERVYWIHPVARAYDDATRAQIRAALAHYGDAVPAAQPAVRNESRMHGEAPSGPRLLRTLPVLECIRTVEGWLSDEEADALLAVARLAVERNPAARIVELGSYCGRATVVLGWAARELSADARVYAIDPHDGRLGALDGRLVRVPPSEPKLHATLRRFELERTVVPVRAAPCEVAWHEPIDLLVVDALHDYASVAADFRHYESSLRAGAFVAFHDDAPYFPGVQDFIAVLRRDRCYRELLNAGTLTVFTRADESDR